MPEIKLADLDVLESFRTTMAACNSSDTEALQRQIGGAYGYAYEGFFNAATALFGADYARCLLDFALDSNESVIYCINHIDTTYNFNPPTEETLDLDNLAEDIATAISDNGYAERGFDVTGKAIRPALPAFIATVLAHQAGLDSED